MLADVLGRLGDAKGLIAGSEQLLRDGRRLPGDEHPRTLEAFGATVATLPQHRKVAEALPLAEALLAATRRAHGERHAKTVAAQEQLAYVSASKRWATVAARFADTC